jgi:hypothetical protein
MNVMARPLEEVVRELPPDLRDEVRDFAEFLLSKRSRRPGRTLRQDWAGAGLACSRLTLFRSISSLECSLYRGFRATCRCNLAVTGTHTVLGTSPHGGPATLRPAPIHVGKTIFARAGSQSRTPLPVPTVRVCALAPG